MGKTINFQLPDPGETAHVIENGRIAFVNVEYCSDEPNPLEDADGLGEIIALRHSTPRALLDRAEKARREDPDAVELSYYEHSAHVWFVRGRQGNLILPDFQWDGVALAGVWIPDDATREAAGMLGHEPGTPARREWMIEQAESACKLFTAWGNGNVYGYTVEVFDLRTDELGEPFDSEDDYRREEPLHSDSCGGFYDQADMEQMIRSSVQEGFSVENG